MIIQFLNIKDNILDYKIDDISSIGYVVDTLKCALWILLNSNSYKETIIATTNIGNDTDTIGAIAGSRFELVNNKKGKEFVFLDKKCKYTDDSVMTLAVAKSLVDCKKDKSNIEEKAISTMVEVGRRYPDCGYGPKFYQWIITENHTPYGSFGNGAAMRISPVGVAINDIDEIKKVTSIITNVFHNHPDSIKGAEAVAIAIRMSLDGDDKDKIKNI